MENFRDLSYFRPDSSDNWGDPSKMSRELLIKLDTLRALTGKPIRVTSGYRTEGSTTDSQHKYGRAVDIMCPDIPLMDFYLLAEKVGFNGIGIYPHWKYLGNATGGLHVDVRPDARSRWMGVLDRTLKQVYVALNVANLKDKGVI